MCKYVRVSVCMSLHVYTVVCVYMYIGTAVVYFRSAYTIIARNKSVNKQISDMKLRTVSIIGDGDYFFRSISMCIYGD